MNRQECLVILHGASFHDKFPDSGIAHVCTFDVVFACAEYACGFAQTCRLLLVVLSVALVLSMGRCSVVEPSLMVAFEESFVLINCTLSDCIFCSAIRKVSDEAA